MIVKRVLLPFVWTIAHTMTRFICVHRLLEQDFDSAALPQRLAALPRPPQRAAPDFATASTLLRILTPLTRRSRRQPCLYRALVLYLLARDAEMEAEIAIGIAPPSSGIRNHAWLLQNGAPVCDLGCQHQSFPVLLQQVGVLRYMTVEGRPE
jgi:hypothetical protein